MEADGFVQDASEHSRLHLRPQGPERTSWPHPHTTAFGAGPRDDAPGPAGGQPKASEERVRGLDQAPGERKGPDPPPPFRYSFRALHSGVAARRLCTSWDAGVSLQWEARCSCGPTPGQRLRSGRGRTGLACGPGARPASDPRRHLQGTSQQARARPPSGPDRPACPGRPRRTHSASPVPPPAPGFRLLRGMLLPLPARGRPASSRHGWSGLPGVHCGLEPLGLRTCGWRDGDTDPQALRQGAPWEGASHVFQVRKRCQ
ncbi:translation initiation factor IF-2-like [Bubalus bubalis]|uniref:translation initiation factor IF-2-like n=1 Tax=Bubalus bubalis TaxID=89462 RepID=UPI001E1B9E5F|nr:translation initiation factor IF-2-like [Bubalus bubalis]